MRLVDAGAEDQAVVFESSSSPRRNPRPVYRCRQLSWHSLLFADQMARQSNTKRVAPTGSAGALLTGNTSWYWRFI